MRVPNLNWPQDLFRDVWMPQPEIDRGMAPASRAFWPDLLASPADQMAVRHPERELADVVV